MAEIKQVEVEVAPTQNLDDPPPSYDKAVSRQSRQASWFAIIGCAFAHLSDGYQQQISSATNAIFQHLYLKKYTSVDQTRVSNALTVGNIIGILLLGYVSDRFSRKAGMVFTSGLVVSGSLMATFALNINGVDRMVWFLSIVRGIAGVGVGGEYPAASAASTEGGNEHLLAHRGPVVVLSTTLQSVLGGPVCIFIYLMTLLASHNNLHKAFHAMYAFSIILPCLVFLFRMRMKDSQLFQRTNFRHANIPVVLVLKKYWFRLFGTSLAFFIYDFVNFPNSIMSSTIISSVNPDSNIRMVAVWQMVLALMSVPGVLLGAWLTNRIGRKWTGILGFGGYLVIGLIVGCAFDQLKKIVPLYIVLYGLMQSLGHMGPGATLGLISNESYPTAVRGLGYGISAAFGKTGAAVGTQCFTPIKENLGQRYTFIVAACCGFVGMLVYWFMTIDMNGKDLTEQDREFTEYLRKNGYVGKIGEKEEDLSTRNSDD